MNNFQPFVSRLECNDNNDATASIHFSRGEFSCIATNQLNELKLIK